MSTALATFPEVERLSPVCIRILGGNPGKFTLQGTNTYLLGRGRERLLIDTGEGRPSWRDALQRVLRDEKATVKTALITHWHHDHQGGIGQLLEVVPSAQVYKYSPQDGQHAISDGQVFDIEGATLTALHTPGHTNDHAVFVLAEEDAMFTGDNVLGHGTAVFEDLENYLQSLHRMKAQFRGRVYPGHGPVIENGVAKVEGYIAHRQERERQVLEVLEQGYQWSSMQLVKHIYRDVPESLHAPAHGGLLQVLRKLQRESRVAEVDGQWVLNERSAL